MRTMAVDLALICASSGRVIQKRSAQHVLERGREVAQKSDCIRSIYAERAA